MSMYLSCWTTCGRLSGTPKSVGTVLCPAAKQISDTRAPQVAIREAAADALAGCLLIAAQRDPQSRNEVISMVFEQAQRGFKLGTSEAIHGSLLGYKELFLEGQTVRDYEHVCFERGEC